jgi:hypothetical protein
MHVVKHKFHQHKFQFLRHRLKHFFSLVSTVYHLRAEVPINMALAQLVSADGSAIFDELIHV